jgi:hemin uptake protein HemP
METITDNRFLVQRLQANRMGGLPIISSDSLFDKRDEVVIVHQGEQYRLRRTRNGKLILTK